MIRSAGPPGRIVEIGAGISALAPGLLWLHPSRTLVAADVHLGYEDVVGSALPLWSTAGAIATLLTAVRSMQAHEVLLLGDAIHGARMSEGAAREVRAGLDVLRDAATLTIVAGNHEGRSRGAAVLGQTVESAERDGWLLLHGDRSPKIPQRCILGHLHPSLSLGGDVWVPAFLAGRHAIVVPALTPYSNGLDVASGETLRALRPFNVGSRRDVQVVAVTDGKCYPFGTLSELCKAMRALA